MELPSNIEALSRDDKLRLIEAIEELERRRREKREVYSPNEGQTPIHASYKRIRAVFAGNGGGKTAMAVNEAIWALQGFNPYLKSLSSVPSKVIVVLDAPDKVDEVWLPSFKKWFNLKPEHCLKNGKPYISEIRFENGSSLRFMFHLQEPLAFESIEADFFIFDEPPPRSIFVALMRGGRTKGRVARFLLVGTPISASWLRKDLFEPWSKGELPDTECFKFGTRVNEKNLQDNYIENYGRHLSEKERRIRFEGDFFDLDGLALAHLFDRTTHLIQPPFKLDPEAPCVVAIDPHPNKKHVAILLGCDRYGDLYYVKEMASKAVPRQFAEDLKAFYQGYRIIDIVCDSSGNTPMSGGDGNKSFVQVLREQRIQCRTTSYEDKNDEEWIMRIQDALAMPLAPNNFGVKRPKLRIVAVNRGIIGDIETVQWQKIKNIDEYKPKLDISSKDYLACLKYALTCNLNWNKSKAKVWKRTRPVKAYGQR